jgi:hypothetical protein
MIEINNGAAFSLAGKTIPGSLTIGGSLVAAGNIQASFGSVDVSLAGQGVKVKEGANCKQGVATLAAGTVTVADSAVTATSRIFLTTQNANGGTPGFLIVSATVPGTSFTILSSNVADTSIVAYEIYEPG